LSPLDLLGFQGSDALANPAAAVDAIRQIATDPRSAISEVGIRTRFGDVGVNPFDPSTKHEGSEGGSAGLSPVGRAVLRFLGVKVYAKTIAGEIVADVTP
jgi:hypothetical protein